MTTPEEHSPQSPPEAPPVSPVPPSSVDGTGTAEERQWGMFAHLSALLGGLLTSVAGGWGCFVGPLIIWLIKKDTMPFVDDQAKEALNFNITVAIACVVLLLFTLVTFGIGLLIAIPIWIVIAIGWLVLTILASIKSSEGVRYRYPFTLRLIK